MKNNNKKRKAETLAEIVASMAAFGVIISGLCDFMAGQTKFIAQTKHRDELMYKAQDLINRNKILEKIGNSDITSDDYLWDADKKVLTVKDNSFQESLEFSLPR